MTDAGCPHLADVSDIVDFFCSGAGGEREKACEQVAGGSVVY